MNTEKTELRLGDCIEEMKRMRGRSVDLVVIDPPYFQIVKEEWDRQWKDLEEYRRWIEEVAAELQRVLKKNGSLYVFTDERVGAYVQVEFDKHFRLLNNLVWDKGSTLSMKSIMGSMRKYCPTTERILFYEQKDVPNNKGISEILHSDPECWTGIKKYLREEKEKTKEAMGFKSDRELYKWVGKETGKTEVCSHYFHESQWIMPSEKAYRALQRGGCFTEPWEKIKEEYDWQRRILYTGMTDEKRGEIKESWKDKARVWNNDWRAVEILRMGNFNHTRRHPTQKPVELIRYLIERSSRKGDVVLDCFSGSGSTLRACQMCGRRGIGIEKDAGYYEAAKEWLGRDPEADKYGYEQVMEIPKLF